MYALFWVALDAISHAFARPKQRFTALFLVVLMLFGVAYPSASVYAASHSTGPTAADIAAKNPHKTSTTPSIGKINTGSPPAPSTALRSSTPAAADARPIGASSALLGAANGALSNEPLSTPTIPKRSPQAHELTNMRTATSTVFQNKDGSFTKTNYFSSHFYKNNGGWEPIDTTLVEDTNAADCHSSGLMAVFCQD